MAIENPRVGQRVRTRNCYHSTSRNVRDYEEGTIVGLSGVHCRSGAALWEVQCSDGDHVVCLNQEMDAIPEEATDPRPMFTPRAGMRVRIIDGDYAGELATVAGRRRDWIPGIDPRDIEPADWWAVRFDDGTFDDVASRHIEQVDPPAPSTPANIALLLAALADRLEEHGESEWAEGCRAGAEIIGALARGVTLDVSGFPIRVLDPAAAPPCCEAGGYEIRITE